MANNDALFPLVNGYIQFETLMTQAGEVLSETAGKTWTDHDDHDPGITLLQALAFNASDLGYRLSLPLADLLTPAPAKQAADGGVFPLEFGPQQALTCGPISADDYCRALLDLCRGDAFLFQNAELVREPEADRYEYWYSPEERQYSFAKPAEGEATRLTLRGNYVLYVQPTREAEADRGAAQAVLDDFLRDHRNLGESVARVVWLEPQNLPVQMVVELDDDFMSVTSVAAILAAIYTAVQAHVTPAVQRCSTAELQARGWRYEDIYQGPYLRHGWIPELPPALRAGEAVTVNLTPLVNTLLAIPGVKRIRSLAAGAGRSGTSWIWKGRAGCYPRLWGANPLATLSHGEVVRLVAHGMDCRASAAEIGQHLPHTAPVENLPTTLPYGRWRNPGAYHPATGRIPPCYGLAHPRPAAQQAQLHQFLLPFEQCLANACQQVALLPDTLAFDRPEGDVAWGTQWPFQEPSVGSTVFQDCSPQIKAWLAERARDPDKELSCVNYLLGYFGARAAPRIFAVPPAQFLASQQGYLRRISDLGYQRANVRIDKVSALQQRIAARLGWGGAQIFNADAPLDSLPFYIVEHRALLPVPPDPQYDELQAPRALEHEGSEGSDFLTLHLPAEAAAPLRVGQVVDLILAIAGQERTIRGLMIAKVDAKAPSFSLEVQASIELQRYLRDLLDPANVVQWRNSLFWLRDMDFPLVYAGDQSGLAEDERRLTSSVQSPYPAFARVGSRLILEAAPAKASPLRSASPRALLTAEVVEADSFANLLVIRKLSGGAFPSVESASKYSWHFDPAHKAATDNFSFVISVVFNQDQLRQWTSDPYAAREWIESVVLDEIPAHLAVVMHWLPDDAFRNFGLTYNAWQNSGAPLGDDSYALMNLLTLGGLPTGLAGIGSMQIATPQQKAQAVGPDGGEWHVDVITEEALLHVPPEPDR